MFPMGACVVPILSRWTPVTSYNVSVNVLIMLLSVILMVKWILLLHFLLCCTTVFRTQSCRSCGKVCLVVIIKIPVIRIIFFRSLDTFYCLQIIWRRSRSFKIQIWKTLPRYTVPHERQLLISKIRYISSERLKVIFSFFAQCYLLMRSTDLCFYTLTTNS